MLFHAIKRTNKAVKTKRSDKRIKWLIKTDYDLPIPNIRSVWSY